jgi:hypothetical protein
MRLVYFSPVPWTSFAQRPHKFVEWFHAKRGGEVLWVDPYPTRLPELADFRRLKSKRIGASNRGVNGEPPHWLEILEPRSLPIEPLPYAILLQRVFWCDIFRSIEIFVAGGKCQIVVGKPSKLALEVLERNPSIFSLYDAMDDFPAFYRGLSRLAMTKSEAKVAARVSRIAVSSTALAARFVAFGDKRTLVLNACSIDVLPRVKIGAKRLVSPIIGYVGTIGHWFDWHLVFALANANPSMLIRLVGPIYSGPPDAMPGNIELLPACDHATAMKHMQEFAVGLIPFKCIDLTESVDPIKYYEYRALGLTVLSTRFGEMARRAAEPGVFLMEISDDLSQLIGSAMSFENDIDEIRAFRAANSWTARFDASQILA